MMDSANLPVLTGYEALTTSVALRPDADRKFLHVSGERADRILNGLLSADVSAIRPGEATLSFILTAKGRPLALPTVIRRDDGILLDVSREALDGLLDHFQTYLPPRFAAVRLREDLKRVSLLGPGAADIARALPLPEGCFQVARHPADGGGVDFYIQVDGPTLEELAAAARQVGGTIASESDYDVWRIERGIPRFGAEITGENLPQETGLVERAVSLEKGCYTGQEVVARIHYRGHVNRRLVGLRMEQEQPATTIPVGTPLTTGNRVVGAVTSSCDSPLLGPIGLAYVRREQATGESVRAALESPFSVRLVELPFTLT